MLLVIDSTPRFCEIKATGDVVPPRSAHVALIHEASGILSFVFTYSSLIIQSIFFHISIVIYGFLTVYT